MDTDKVVGNAIEEQKQKHVPLSNVSNIKRPSAFMNSGEASDDDSSLLLDENHEDESSEDHQHGNKKWNGQQNNFNFDNQTKGNIDGFDTNFLWSLQQNNKMNKPRKTRRKW